MSLKRKQIEHIDCHVLCCTGSTCRKHGADETFHMLKEEIAALDPGDHIHLTKTHCNNLCKHGPIVMIYPDSVWYEGMTAQLVKKFIKKRFKKGKTAKKQVLHSLKSRD